MIRYVLDLEVIGQDGHQTFQLPECNIEQLTDQEADEQVPFRHRRAACALDPLVERERIRELADALHRQMQVLDEPLRIDGQRRGAQSIP
jgi:hypothetical protein